MDHIRKTLCGQVNPNLIVIPGLVPGTHRLRSNPDGAVQPTRDVIEPLEIMGPRDKPEDDDNF
jgi:hypothetical protein